MSAFNHRDGRHLDINGARIYVEQQGDPQGPALLFLHGGLGDIETFNAIAPQLGKTYRLIGVDTRGQGKSTLGVLPLTYEQIQLDVSAVIQHLELGEVSIIGHSDGGIAALRLAAGNSVKIDRLVTIGAHWALDVNDQVYQMYSAITAQDWREMFPQDVERYQAQNPEPDFEKLMEAVRQLWLDTSEDGYPAARVGDIGARLLVVRGDGDTLVSRSNALELAERVAGARLLNMPFAEHSPHEERPEWLLSVLEVFLQAP